REWLVSYKAQQMGKDPGNRNHRDDAEHALNEEHREKRDDPLTQCWSTVIELRNDLAHCGFGRDEGQKPRSEKITKRAWKVLEKLKQLLSNANIPT
ncbi:MAG: TM1812 family CRISPR-associated protein, partial [Armatimonadota bacterium]